MWDPKALSARVVNFHFLCKTSNLIWIYTNVYGPNDGLGRAYLYKTLV